MLRQVGGFLAFPQVSVADNRTFGVGEVYSCRMTTTRKRLRASGYVRLSKQAGETNLSGKGMMDDVRALSERLGCDLVHEHMDDGVSGAIRDRPEFTAWLNDARRGDVDLLLTYHADRLTREGVNAAAMVLDVIEGKDPDTGRVIRTPVRLVDCEGIDSDQKDAFRWRFVIAAEVARAERERIKSRNLATRKRLLEAGRWVGGTCPYGTQVTTDDDGNKILEINEREAGILRDVAARLIGGSSMRAEIRWLDAEGIVTRRGGKWTRSSLRATLLSDASAQYVFNRATRRALGKRFATGPSQGPKGGRPKVWLLSGGLALCESCGSKMTTSAGRYVCWSGASGAADCPAQVSIDAKAVDTYMEQQFLARFGPIAPLQKVVVVVPGEVDAAEKAVEDAEAALLEDLSIENMTTLKEARAELERLNALPTEAVDMWKPMKETVEELWGRWDAGERAWLLREMLEGPVTMLRNPGGRPKGRQKVDVENRLRFDFKSGVPTF